MNGLLETPGLTVAGHLEHGQVKVAPILVYNHTRIASYRHLRVGNIGKPVRLLVLGGYECCAAGGFPNNPILSGPRRNGLPLLTIFLL